MTPLVVPRTGAVLSAAIVSVGVAFAPPAAAVNMAAGFEVVDAVANGGFNMPTALAFMPDGRILVAEKRGVVRVVQNGLKLAPPMWSGEREVLSNGDRGLLGIAVDPSFALNGYVYLLYSVDPDSNGVDDNDDAFGRLARYRVSAADSNVLDPASRTLLLGATWREGFPSGSISHAIGGLRWGEDGSLLISCGDGANYAGVDSGGRDPGLFGNGRIDPHQDLGAFRAQSLSTLNGKILRVDPGTGEGYPSNPYYDGDPRSNRSRVWAAGLRNPFRFCVRPGTGQRVTAAGDPGIVVAGDVGWMNEEEVDVIRPGDNLGWPCYEGMSEVAGYQAVRSVSPNCSDLRDGLTRAPLIAYHQADTTRSTIHGVLGRCVIGGVFNSGGSYPPSFRGRYFFADFSSGWIKAAALDENNELRDVVDFATDAEGPVDFAVDPLGGEIHYLALHTGRLYRVQYHSAPRRGAQSRTCWPEGTAGVDLGPSRFSLVSSWPNPSSRGVNLVLRIDREAWVGISIFDAQGRLVWTDPTRPRVAGHVPLLWSGADQGGRPVAAGVYIARVSVEQMTFTRRLVVER